MATPPRLDDAGRPTPSTLFLTVHHGLRRDAARFGPAVLAAAAPPYDPERLAAVARHWTAYAEVLLEHHRQEDAWAFPQILTAEPALAEVLARLEGEHHALDGLLARLDAAFARLAPDPASAPACAALCRELDDVLAAHLDLEEEHLVAVMDAGHVPPPPREDAGAGGAGGVVGGASGPFGPIDPAFALPWMVDDLDPSVAAVVMGILPPDLQAAAPDLIAAYPGLAPAA